MSSEFQKVKINSGMNMNPLHKKLVIKDGSKVLFLNATVNFMKEVLPLPANSIQGKQLRGKYDVLIYFASTKIEVLKVSGKLISSLNPSAALWIAYPEKVLADRCRFEQG